MRRIRLVVLAVAAGLLSCLFAGPAMAQGQQPAAVIDAVDIPVQQWQPANVTIDVGETVRWEYDSPNNQNVHNVKSTSANWNVTSPYEGPNGEPFEYTFTAPGVYTFICQVHPNMTGSVTVQGETQEPADQLENVLVFSKTAGFRHDSIPAGIAAIEQLGQQNDFNVDATEDAAAFNSGNLATYDAVVFLSTTGDVLNDEQQRAFEAYIQSGGGYVGIHAASDTEYTWPWYGEMLGGYFRNHPPGTPTATVRVEDRDEPSTAHLPADWVRTDEWYNFQAPTDPVVGGNQGGIVDYSPRESGVHVLATVDESTYDEQDDSAGADDHPIAWCSDFDGGHTWYTGGGHTAASFSEANFVQHILGGLETVTGAAASDCGEPREAAPSAGDFEIVTIDDDTESPMELDVADDGRVFYIERVTGEVNVWDPATGGVSTAIQIPVDSSLENGGLGIQLSPDFDTTGHVYVSYTPPKSVSATTQRLSRFTVQGNTINPASEQVIFTWELQREICCHSSGSLAFDAEGNLYIATGDNTNPFESQGFAPIDERPGRGFYDAQRTSANTNDLNGKVLKITPIPNATGTPGVGTTYTIPEGNMFPEAQDTQNKTRPEIYAMGFRNPFRITVDPATGWVLLGDYGPDAGSTNPNRGPQGSVEFNVVPAPGFYGWPYCVRANTPYNDYNFATSTSGAKFDCQNPVNTSPNNTGLTNLPAAQPATMWLAYGETDPRFPGLGTGGAPTGGPRYDFDPALESDTKFPEYYDGHWFIGEWNRGWIKTATLNEQGGATSVQETPWMDTFARPHEIEFGPEGSLYVIDWGTGFGGNNADSGIYRIDYVRGARRPIATATATPDSGPTPLQVTFSSDGSIDPDGTSLTYEWDFDGDGDFDSTDASPTFTYTQAGTYNALLRVTDQGGQTSTDTIQVIAGNTRPEVEIVLPTDGQFANFGERVPYEVRVSDVEDGEIDCDKVVVSVQLGHDDHAHGLGSETGCEGFVETETDGGHGASANIFTSLVATYTDAGGSGGAGAITGRDDVVLHPKRKQAEYFDSTGRTTTGSTGGTPGVQTENTSDTGGGTNIGFTEHGDYLAFERMSLEGLRALRFRVASAGAGGTIQVRLDAPDGQLVAETANIAPTGGWQTWTTVEAALTNPPEGTHELFIVFNNPAAGNNSLMNLNWFEAVGRGAAVSEAPTVSASATPGSGSAPLAVQFTGTATDPDAGAGEQMTYTWDFGVAGTTDDTSTQQNPTYTYTRPGTYNVTFTAKDAAGASSSATTQVRVTAGSSECPTNNVRSDEFEGTGLDTSRWSVIRPDDTRPFTVEGGELNFPVDDGSIYEGGNTARNIVVQPLPDGDVEVTAKINTEPLTENYQQAGLRVYADDDNWASVHMISAGGNRDFEFIYENNGSARNTGEDKLNGIPADSPNEYYVRIISDGDTLRAEYSWDGEEFLPVGRPADISGWTNPRIGPVALNGVETTGYPVASFDWIRFNPDEAVGGGGGGGGGIEDQFEGDDLGTDWNVVRRDQNLTVSGGTLNLPAQTGDLYQGRNDAKNLVLRDAPDGAWEATAKLNFEGTAQYHQAGIMIYGDDQNFTKFGRIAHSAAGAEKFEFIYENAGVARNTAADSTTSLPNEFPDDFWVRLTSDGTNVTGAYSTDGSTWTPVGRAAPLPANAQIGLFAFSNEGAGNPVAAFDSFTLTGDAVGGGGGGGGPVGPSFDDQFDGSELDTTRWNAIVRNNPDLYDVADGALTVTTDAGDIYTGDSNPAPDNFILQSADHAGEDWVIETKLSTNLNGGYGQGGLMAYQDGDNYVKFDAISDDGQTRINRLELRAETNGTIGPNPADPQVPAGTTDIWLRLTKEGDSYKGEYSFDGTTWQALASPVTHTMDAPDFGVFAIGPLPAGQGDQVSFDYFTLDGEDPAGQPCECVPGPGDEFDGTSLNMEKFNAIVGDDATKYAVSDGGLTVTTTSGEIYQDSTGGGPLLLQSADSAGSDWVLETTLSHQLNGGYSQGGILAYGSNDDYVKINAISDDGQSTVNRLELRSETGSEIGPAGTDPSVPAGTETIGLRLTKSGNTYSGEYSFDGGEWTPFGYTVTNVMAAPDFGLYTQGVLQSGDTVTFDYFAVNGDRGACEPGGEPDNRAPVIGEIAADPTTGYAPLAVDFTVEATDADEDELTYSWDFDGDGEEDSDQQNPSFTYTQGGVYEAKVTVSDGEAERTRTVTVNVFGADDPEARFRVLVFSKTTGFRHSSIDEGIAAIRRLGQENGFQVDATEDATLFRDNVLERYDSVIWLSTTGDVLNDEQQAAFERYIRGGGGYTGIHAAADTEYSWKWYGDLVGAYFLSHPQNQTATVDVEDRDDPSTEHLDATWERYDEWYNYKPVNFEETGNVDYSPRGDVHVLASLDENTYDEGDGTAAADDHPISWCQRYDGGRSWYTGMGHTEQSFTEDEAFLAHILGGIEVSAGAAESEECGEVDGNQPGAPTVQGFANPDSGTAPLQVRFSATGLDPENQRLTYKWEFGDGGQQFARNARHTYREAGTYTAVVTATDEDGNTAQQELEIVVSSTGLPITADADVTSGPAPMRVRFEAMSEGRQNELTYEWDFGDGNTAFGRRAVHRYMEAGDYTATVTVTNGAGSTGTAEVQITVEDPPGNVAPNVEVAGDPTSGRAPLQVSFTTHGTDPDGDRLSYSWDFGDGTPAAPAARNARHTYTRAGTFTATVTVTDTDGATHSDTVQVTVLGNRAPTVRAAADPSSATAPARVTFTAAGRDEDGDNMSYVWDFGNGVQAAGPRAVHTYTQAGSYTATVTVRDAEGGTGTASVTVTVAAAQNRPPRGNGNGNGGVAGKADRLAVRVARQQAVRRVAKRGLRYTVSAGAQVRVASELRVGKKVARKLGLRRGARTLGAGKARKVGAGASRKMVVKLDRTLRKRQALLKAMRRAGVKRVVARIVLTADTAEGTTRKVSKRVVLKA